MWLIMTLWKSACWLPVAVGFGRLAVSGGVRVPAGQPQPVRVVSTIFETESDWLPWVGSAAVAVVVVVGLLVWWRRHAIRIIKPSGQSMPMVEVPRPKLVESPTVQILEEDLTGVMEVFARLRAGGVTDLINHLASNPDLPREWLGRVRLVDANQPAITAAGFTDRKQMISRFPQHTAAPYLDVFRHQLGQIWTGRRQFQEEFNYLGAGGHGRTCLMQCRVEEREGKLDYSRVALVLFDITTTKRAVSARIENQDLVRRILARADIILWWAQVRRENVKLDWQIVVPEELFDTPLFQLASARTRGGLWEPGRVPEFEEINVCAQQAMFSGSRGYQQEFRVLSATGDIHWVNETVEISSMGPDEWSLVGVVTEVTAQHKAEEERRKSQAQLQRILARADCMVWQARVTESAGQFTWEFEMLPSGLQKRIFGGDTGFTHRGVSGVKVKSMYGDLVVPEQARMDACALGALRSGAPGYEQEYRLIKGDQTIWVHEWVSITTLQPGQWDLGGITIDVTAEKTAEEARHATEAQLQEILEQVDCLLWYARVRDANGRIEWQFDVPASGLQRRLFGVEGALKSTELYASLTVPELSEMHARSAAALRGGAPGYEQDFRIVKPERTYWLHESVSISPRGPGQWLLFGVIIDVSATKEAEQAIRASETRYRELFEGAMEGVFQSTPEGRLIKVNPALARIFGCATPEEFLAWTKNGAIPLYVRAGRRDEYFSELKAHDRIADFESEVYTRDGSVKRISENVRAVRDADGRLLHFQGFISDVTERYKARTV